MPLLVVLLLCLQLSLKTFWNSAAKDNKQMNVFFAAEAFSLLILDNRLCMVFLIFINILAACLLLQLCFRLIFALEDTGLKLL